MTTTKRIFALLLCFVMLASILSACAASSPKALAKKVEKAINKNNAKAFMQCIDPDSKITKEQAEQALKIVRAGLDGKKIKITVLDVDYADGKKEADVKVKIKLGDVDKSGDIEITDATRVQRFLLMIDDGLGIGAQV